MPIRPTPVRNTCGRCNHRWVFAPLGDALLQQPGICPKCGHDSPSEKEPLSSPLAKAQNWLSKRLS